MKNLDIPIFKVEERAENFYGIKFWDLVENGFYENEQILEITELIKRKHKENITPLYFIDMGASSGIYSLIAGSLNCDVVSLEPDEDQYRALKLNTELNSLLGIKILKAFVVGKKNFEISPYALNEKTNVSETIDRINIIDLFKPNCSIIIKCDIEGGEWNILRSKNFKKFIKKSSGVTIFLSVHIGFFSKNYNKGIIQRTIFRIKYVLELLTLYTFTKRANLIVYNGLPVNPRFIIKQDRIFGGAGFTHHVQLVFD